MELHGFRRLVAAAVVFFATWLGVKYLLPLAMPFLLGALIALAAEPAVDFLCRRTGMGRGAAAGLGVSGTLLFAVCLLWLLGSLAVRELGNLTGAVPELAQTAQGAVRMARDGVEVLICRLPEAVQPTAQRAASQLLDGGNALIESVGKKLPAALGAVLGWLPRGALGIGTGVLAGFMISARLPRLKVRFREKVPRVWYTSCLPALKTLRLTLGGWLKAQGKLAGVTFGLVAAGFVLLGIGQGIWWALPVAAVDAIPVLGTGIILIPWAIVCFFQGQTFRAVGLGALWIATALLRRVLEPKLVGRHLELDPLVTLIFLYLGCRLWGFWGMILAPLLAGVAKQVTRSGSEEN